MDPKTLSPTKANSSKPITSLYDDKNFEFVPPPEAPVFYPTEEEFKDPLEYINKIRKVAEDSGICKIKPPANWQPPFAVDVDKLRFVPRIQRLNELEAKTRVKLNFLDKIAKFWELQGSTLKIPMLERKCLDLYTLHNVVQAGGGFDQVCKDRKWSKIGIQMGYSAGKAAIGCILKQHYERLLYPYDLFNKEGKNTEQKITTVNEYEKDYKPHEIIGRQAIKPPSDKHARRSKRCDLKEEKDVKKTEFDPLDKYVCHNCRRGDSEEYMLLCDGCDDSYHTFCLMPPLSEIPKGDWRCPKCVAEEVSKPMEAFGFEQAQREYTLQQFGEMADQFKAEYFNMPGHLVPLSKVEKEFWRIVSSIDEDVTVEYAADLHTMDHGSGFPTKNSFNLLPGDKEYADSGWNLNNLPVLENSVLGYINADISGMKVPWMYVGMCFSTFCWHNEDHWSYSINYLHWGEPKTWYGVSGKMAEAFEDCMKSAAPELFHSQPDLLHQLVTIMNPNILMNTGIPVFRTNQHAGEFVVTFPRSYHAGFNQGYNFAEAVNFAPADWLRMGRESVLHYSNLRRFCVFSHDELICHMALEAEKLTLTIAAATYQDMLTMVETEKSLRKNLLEAGVTNAERQHFELIPDDERQCDTCKTTCFLSAVTCGCNPQVLVCLRHYKNLCHCHPRNFTLRYRYTLDELPGMLKNLKLRAESFDTWLSKVKSVQDTNLTNKLSLDEFKNLVKEAEDKKFPKCDLVQTLKDTITDAEKCVKVIQLFVSSPANNKYKLTLKELTLFNEELNGLPCQLDEAKVINELLGNARKFETNSSSLLSKQLSECSLEEIENCINLSNKLSIELPSVGPLKTRQAQVVWIKDVLALKDKTGVPDLQSLKKIISTGSQLIPHPEIEAELAKLHEIVTKSEEWENKVKKIFNDKSEGVIAEASDLLKEANSISCCLPSEETLMEAWRNANEWMIELNQLNHSEYDPYINDMKDLIMKGKQLKLHIAEIDRLADYVQQAENWKLLTKRTFSIRRNSPMAVMKVLSPKVNDHPIVHLSSALDPAVVMTLFKDAGEIELENMKQVRALNATIIPALDTSCIFCVCNRGIFGTMIECALCKGWFHTTCTSAAPRVIKYKGDFLSIAYHLDFKDCKFLCMNCQQSKRPVLGDISPLLDALKDLYVRLPEGDALQSLLERAINWQDKAKQLLQSSEVDYLQKSINSIQLKSKEKEKTECITLVDSEQTSDEVTCDAFLVPKGEELPIRSELRQKIEDLLLEGDLLEVKLEETSILWKILLATRDFQQNPLVRQFNIEPPKSRTKKRRSEDGEVRKRRVYVNKKKRPSMSNKSLLMGDEEEEDETCAAEPCGKPPEENINWVQCDGGCEKWFHMACVGLSPLDINEDEDYVCTACSVNVSASTNIGLLSSFSFDSLRQSPSIGAL